MLHLRAGRVLPMISGMVSSRRVQTVAAILLLAGLCWLAFGGALQCGFVHYDDPRYVYENEQVVQGLTKEGVVWAFTTDHISNWHPLTWISHMADVEVYGLNPAGHHATSLLLHMANAILLFLILRGMTGRFIPSLLLAALFAVHPLRVQSVVWVSERKDVLSMFFGLLAVRAYGRRPMRGRMVWVAFCFALSLMSKPLWVTLPFVLLLLDVWPLRRWPGKSAWALIREKGWLFLLATASCVLTYLAQSSGGAVRTLEGFPPGVRLANAVVATVEYLRASAWPSGLAFFYPHPGADLSPVQVGASLLLLLVLTGLALWAVRRRPWWTVGWLWFLGTLVPMIGLVQVGEQAWADRYSYLPQIGLLLALIWGATEIVDFMLKRWPRQARVLHWSGGVLAGGLVLALVLLSRRETLVWHDSKALFQHAVLVTTHNAIAHGNLGAAFAREGLDLQALEQLHRSLEILPRRNMARLTLAKLHLKRGETREAARQYREVVADFPAHVESLNNLAWLLASDSACTPAQAQEARMLAQQALAVARANPVDTDPPLSTLLDTLASTQAACGDYAAAVDSARKAARQAAFEGDMIQHGKILGRVEAYQANLE